MVFVNNHGFLTKNHQKTTKKPIKTNDLTRFPTPMMVRDRWEPGTLGSPMARDPWGPGARKGIPGNHGIHGNHW